MAPARHAAWNAYLTITKDLLPAIKNDYSHGPALYAQLDGMLVQITRYATLWGPQGPMLVAAAQSAVRIFRDGDRDELVVLLRSLADRLYLLSITPGRESWLL